MPQVCRTCFQETADRNYIELENDHQSVDIRSKIEFCIPEVDLALTAKPVVCIVCVGLLNSAFTFKKQCLDTEHSVKKFLFGLEGFSGTIELKDIYSYNCQNVERSRAAEVQIDDTQADTTMKVEDMRVVNDLNDLLDDALNVNFAPDVSIDIEEHIVKIEVDEDDDVICIDEDLLIPKDNRDDLQCEAAFTKTAHTNTLKTKKRRGRPARGNTLIVNLPSSSADSDTPFPCEYCDFISLDFNDLLAHLKCHKDSLKDVGEPYFCPLCKMRSKWKPSIIKHMKIHNVFVTPPRDYNNVSAMQGKCDKCPFVTRSKKWKAILAAHRCLAASTEKASNSSNTN